MYKGTVITLGDTEFTVAPLTFKQLRTLEPELITLESMSTRPTSEQQDAVMRIIHASVSRNNPEVSLDDMGDLIDMGNLRPAIEAVMGVSGLVSKSGE